MSRLRGKFVARSDKPGPVLGMKQVRMANDRIGLKLVNGLGFKMFLVAAMTTDAAGVVIPEIIKSSQATRTAGGAVHRLTTVGIRLRSGVRRRPPCTRWLRIEGLMRAVD